MGFIKNKIRPKVRTLHSGILDWCMAKLMRLQENVRWTARVRMLNRWGRKNPKRLCWYYMAFLTAMISLNVLPLFLPSKEGDVTRDEIGLTAIMESGDVFNGMSTLTQNRLRINSAVNEYKEAAHVLVLKADSLLAKKNKTRADSLEIARLYESLK